MLRNLDEKLYLPIVLIVGVIALILSLIRQDILWSTISIVYLALMLGISTVSHELEKRWDLIKFIVVPLFLGATGITGIFHNRILFLAIVPIIAFIIILNLIHHTTFQGDYDFKGNLITAFTISTGAFLGVGRFLSDLYLNTNFLRGNIYLMIDLLFFTIFGIIGGVSFKDYLMNIDYSKLDRLRFKLQDNSKEQKREFLEVLGSGTTKKGSDLKILVSQILQMGIVIIAIYSVLTADLPLLALSLPAFGLTMVPYFYTRNIEGDIPSFFYFLVSVSLFLYLLGVVTDFYSIFPPNIVWWNRLIHFTGGTVGAFLIYVYLFYRNRISDEFYLSHWMIAPIVISFLISLGVAWELFEFFFDIFFGTTLQNDLTDTICDITFNIIGALFAVIITHLIYISKSK